MDSPPDVMLETCGRLVNYKPTSIDASAFRGSSGQRMRNERIERKCAQHELCGLVSKSTSLRQVYTLRLYTMANSLTSLLLVRLSFVLCLLVQAKSKVNIFIVWLDLCSEISSSKVPVNIMTFLYAGVLIIEKEPSSLLIPANEIGVFSCQARCRCNGYWKVNGTRHHSIDTRRMISNYTESSGTLTLTVNASEAMNNTSIQCNYEENGIGIGYNYSAIVYLLVVSSKYENLIPL